MTGIHSKFDKVATLVAKVSGSAGFFGAASIGTLIWLASGHYFDYSDSWQLVANTITTIITFLVAIITQYTVNKDTARMENTLNTFLEKAKDK